MKLYYHILNYMPTMSAKKLFMAVLKEAEAG